jgi:hypothetical protein
MISPLAVFGPVTTPEGLIWPPLSRFARFGAVRMLPVLSDEEVKASQRRERLPADEQVEAAPRSMIRRRYVKNNARQG